MNLKRLIALGFLGMTLGMGQAYGISVNIPGVDATMSVDEYQNYRKNTAESRLMEQRLMRRFLIMICLDCQQIFIIIRN